MLYVHLAAQYPCGPRVMHVQAVRYMQGIGAPVQAQVDNLGHLEVIAG